MRLIPLLGRRVPAYISMPIIAACAAAGFIASGMHSGKTTTGARQTDPPVERTRTTAATPTVGISPRQRAVARRGGKSAARSAVHRVGVNRRNDVAPRAYAWLDGT